MSQSAPDYRLKIERAKSHIAELAREIGAFNAEQPYSILIEQDHAAKQYVWKLKITKSVPRAWSTILGDAVHNIRASLDLLFCAVVRKCDPTRANLNHVHFVVRETKQQFEADIGANIRGASDEAIGLVHNLKPYKGGDDLLWRLHKLDILDKHQGIVPVGAAYRGVDLAPLARVQMVEVLANSDFGKSVIANGMLNPGAPLDLGPLIIRPADRQYPLRDGAVLFRAPLNHPLPANGEKMFFFEISFGEGQIVDGESVIPTLYQLADHVASIFDAFERSILA